MSILSGATSSGRVAATDNGTPDLEQLFVSGTPLLDVRAPVEVAKGGFPNATNIPLLDDQQRHEIGLRYAEQGQDAAIELGLALATPEIRQQRLDAWTAFIEQHPTGYLFCFRGGLRSRTTQQWLRDTGIDYPLIPGGYKALRRFLLDRMHGLIAHSPARVLAGPTGSGKTEVIHAWLHSLDLEGLANHKGSAFGQAFSPQPSQIDWEHRFTIDWMRRTHDHSAPVLLEDESRLIGRIFLPPELQTLLACAPEIALVASMPERIERLRHDYVMPIVTHYQQQTPDQAEAAIIRHIEHTLNRIRKRLGGARHSELSALVPMAVNELLRQDNWAVFDGLIEQLLTDYYDPMYRYQQGRSRRPQAFAGTHDEVLDWLSRTDGLSAS